MATGSDRHPALLRASETLLMVIDMQEPFLRNVWERDRVVAQVGLLVEAAHVLGVPILATLQNTAKMGGVVPEVAERLPKDCVPLNKFAFSCAADAKCAAEIVHSARKQVLLCGVETHICILQTAHDLTARGYQVHVAADAVSSRTEENRALALQRMGRAGIILSSVEAALYEMMATAENPRFRDVLRLVK